MNMKAIVVIKRDGTGNMAVLHGNVIGTTTTHIRVANSTANSKDAPFDEWFAKRSARVNTTVVERGDK